MLRVVRRHNTRVLYTRVVDLVGGWGGVTTRLLSSALRVFSKRNYVHYGCTGVVLSAGVGANDDYFGPVFPVSLEQYEVAGSQLRAGYCGVVLPLLCRVLVQTGGGGYGILFNYFVRHNGHDGDYMDLADTNDRVGGTSVVPNDPAIGNLGLM